MKVRFTKVIEEVHEVDIPLQVIEEEFNGYVEDALDEYIQKSEKIDENVEIDDITKGCLDMEDNLWEQLMEERYYREIQELNREYYAGLGIAWCMYFMKKQ